MNLVGLLTDIGIKCTEKWNNINIKGLAYNSHHIKKGYIFVAIKGFQTDGHRYIHKAIENQAAFIIIEELSLLKKYNLDHNDEYILYKNKKVPYLVNKNNRIMLSALSDCFYDHPSRKMKLIGVTGTNGKTTITYLIESILKANKYKVGVIGTINYHIGKKVIPASATTPESLDLQMLLHKMYKQKVDYVVMEVSSHALELNRVDHCQFDHVVFSNLTEDHFDFHKNFTNYFKAKQRLFDLLLKSEKKVKSGFINFDDKYGRKLFKRYKKSRKISLFSYGTGLKADLHADDFQINLNQTEFNFKFKKKNYHIISRLIGRFNVYNILAAMGIGIIEKISMPKILKALKQFSTVPGRMEIVKVKDFYAGIDYAHTEDALCNVLKTVKDLNPTEIVTVFGCGGDRDRTKRPLMGEVAGEYSDFIIITSDNPRTEEPKSIINEIEPGVKKKSTQYIKISNRRKAILKGLAMMKKGGFILIAGKGHEDYQIIGKKKIHFDDKEIVKEYMSKKRN